MGAVHSRALKDNMLIAVVLTTAVVYSSSETAVMGFESLWGQGFMTTFSCDVFSCTAASLMKQCDSACKQNGRLLSHILQPHSNFWLSVNTH
jgi:hypothetical protein